MMLLSDEGEGDEEVDYKVIVARYNESVDWLLSENDNAQIPIENIVIYNKGSALNVPNEVLMPNNVGRESHTFLTYIIENYSNLPDVCVFTQANISDHYPKRNDVSFLMMLLTQARAHGKSLPALTYLHYREAGSEHKKNPNEPYFSPSFNFDATTKCFFMRENYLHGTPVLFYKWFKTHIQPSYPNPIRVYPHALFAVNKRLILKHPVEFYEGLMQQVSHNVDPAEGHFMERAWFYIFQ